MTGTTTHEQERALAESFLASFVPRAVAERRAAQLGASGLEAGGADDSQAASVVLERAVAHVRNELGIPDSMIASVLHHEVGITSSRAAQLAGLSVHAVNGVLDRGDALDVVDVEDGSARARRIGHARTAIRALWAVLLVLALVAYVDQRGGALPCANPVCVDGVEIVLADGSSVLATSDETGSSRFLFAEDQDGSFEPNEIAGLRYSHRSTTPVAVTAVWISDGRELLVQRLNLVGAASTTVVWPGGSMPIGVHLVELSDGNGPVVRVSFSVELTSVG